LRGRDARLCREAAKSTQGPQPGPGVEVGNRGMPRGYAEEDPFRPLAVDVVVVAEAGPKAERVGLEIEGTPAPSSMSLFSASEAQRELAMSLVISM
jgi:hypothetical protein